MEEKVNMPRRIPCFLLFLSFLLLTGCTGIGPLVLPTIIGPTVTPNLDPSPSLTPFGPQAILLLLRQRYRQPIHLLIRRRSRSADTPTSVPTLQPATSTVTIMPSPLIQTPGPVPAFVPSKYNLSVMMDYAGHALSTDETIQYVNSTGENLSDVVLAVEPNLWKGCFIPGSMTINGQSVSNSTLSDDKLEIPLPAPLSPDGSLDLFMHFDLHLPAADVYHVFGYNDYQTNLVDWYPFIVPYVPGQGWLLHPLANVGEHLAYDVESIDMTLHLTDPNLHPVVAASAPAESITLWVALSIGKCAFLRFFCQHWLQDGFNQGKWRNCEKLLFR